MERTHTKQNIEPLRSHALVACCFVGFNYSHIHIIYICILPYVCSRDMFQNFVTCKYTFPFWERSNRFPLEICFKFTQNAFITVKHICLCQMKPMLGLSFNTKSNVPVFEVFKCQNIIYLLFMPSLTSNKMFCITSRRYGDNAKQHRFYYIIKQSSVFFPYV